MAVIAGGNSHFGASMLEYSFEFTVNSYSNWASAAVVNSNIFVHNGDRWQLQLLKKALGMNHLVDCQLQMIANKNGQLKIARLTAMTLPTGYVNCTSNGQKIIFHASGDGKICKLSMVQTQAGAPELAFVVRVEILKYDGVADNNVLKPLLQIPKSEMITEALKWFESEEFGDVTIVAVDGQKFRSYRGILSARSEVFRLMFNTEMKESQESVVNTHFDANIVALLLTFIHIDKCGEIAPFADVLYAAAHEYQLERLKLMCESAMIANLSDITVVKFLRLALFYSLDKLAAECCDYLKLKHNEKVSLAEVFAKGMKIEDTEGKVTQEGCSTSKN